MWLRVLLLLIQLSLVLSSVIVITINDDDDEQNEKIYAIEAKLDSQDREIERLGNISQTQNGTINLLNKVSHELQEQVGKYQDKFQNTSATHQDQLDQLNKKIKEILNHDAEFEMQVKENDAKLNKTFQDSYKHQQEQIENLTKQNERLKEDIQNISKTKVPLKNQDILGFELAATRGWLGCPFSPCDLRECPPIAFSRGKNIFTSCGGEIFQIFGDGGEYIRSGYKVRIKFREKWLSCYNGSCFTKTCPGSTTQATNFTIPCNSETFAIYAHARRDGDVIYDKDLVMLYINANGAKYISIKGTHNGDDTSLDYCPGSVPPTYFSFFACTKNVLQIYKNT